MSRQRERQPAGGFSGDDTRERRGRPLPAQGKQYLESIRIGIRASVPLPIGIGGRHRRLGEALRDGVKLLLAIDKDHEQRFGMRIWRMVTAAGREFEMRASSRDLKENSVIPVVTLKPADLRKANAIPVERDDFIKLVGVTGDTQFHRTIIANVLHHMATPGRFSTQIG